MDITLFLAGTDVAELDSGDTVVVGLDDCKATVAPSKPSRSMSLSQSIGVGEGKLAIGDSVLSCCC